MVDAHATTVGTPGRAPLARRTVLCSGDVEELTVVGTELFSPHRLRYRGSRARLSATPVEHAQLICLQYHGESVVETTEALDYYAVHSPVAGRSVVTFGRESVRPPMGGGVVFSPGDRPVMGWSADLCQLAIRVPAARVRAHVSMLTGRPTDGRLRFRHLSVADSGWISALRTMATVADRHDAVVLPDRLSGRLLDMFLTALVLTQPSTYADALLAEAPPPSVTAIELAAQLIDADPDQPWSLARLASETGVSGRSLQAGFRRYKECSPMAFVRERRLELAHRLLLDPAYASTPIAQIAADAGFPHLGRFAAAYRRRYGVTPSHMRKSAVRAAN
ncbi:AraC family transcriptional regulator [Sphaerisporangium sp. NPDC051011]|uniref:helix-turn-helix transcriptional regulator n=1 Tax=Sphaerisporangium sp. NPDC051011 TaxID=3155792 RepID=UPI0033F55786